MHKKSDLKTTHDRLQVLHAYLLDAVARAKARGVSSVMMPVDSLVAQAATVTASVVDLESHLHEPPAAARVPDPTPPAMPDLMTQIAEMVNSEKAKLEAGVANE